MVNGSKIYYAGELYQVLEILNLLGETPYYKLQNLRTRKVLFLCCIA